jgi:hypothetical protein
VIKGVANHPSLNPVVVGRSVVVTCEDVVLGEEQGAGDERQAGEALLDKDGEDEKKLQDSSRQGVANSEPAGGDC